MENFFCLTQKPSKNSYIFTWILYPSNWVIEITSTSSKVVYFDQLLGAVLCRRLYIPTSSCVLFAIHIISYYDKIDVTQNEPRETKS